MVTNGRSVLPRAIDDVGDWNHSADVVIVGYGVAGAAAAVEAATHGADVLVLEWAGGWGGAASLSGGFIYLGGGTATQQACGFDDSPEEMFKFLMAAMGPGADEAKTRLYSDESVAHYDWLVELGVCFKPEFYGEPGWVPEGDQGLMYSGGENAWPFNEIAEPAPRGHLPQLPGGADRTGSQTSPGGTAERGGGYYLMEPLVSRAESLGVRAEYNVRTDALVTDGDGRVAGVIGTRFGQEIAVRARRGVILAAGSFIFNDDMVARFSPEMLGRPGSATELHDGHGIRMAHALGADLGRMDGCEVAGGTDPQQMCRGIVVNRVGQRFVTEDTYPGRVAQHIRFKQDDLAFLVVDEEIYEAAPEASVLGPKIPPDWVCATIGELEAEMGLPDGALAATVDLYNRYAERGEDPLFHKNEQWIKPLRAPFGAYDLRHRTGGFTLGGLRTDTDGRVLHVEGTPIPGLLAAGRTASGIPVWGYASGASLGDGSFFGRRAGRAVATDA
jgi:3-oxo-5alpha-steroid 4-dehydrogenase